MRRNVDKKPLSVALVLSHVVKQPALDSRQSLEHSRTASETEQGLGEGEIQERSVKAGVGAGKLPDDRVGDTRQELTPGGREFASLKVRIRGQRAELLPSGSVATDDGLGRRIAAEELRLKAKSLERHVQGRQIQGLQLRLVFARMEPGQPHRPLQVDHDFVFFVRGQIPPPIGDFDIRQIAVLMPTRKPFHAAHAIHVAMCFRIVGRHRRPIGIGRIEKPRTGIDIDRVVFELESGRDGRLRDGTVRRVVGLTSIIGARTARERDDKQC